jgi:hypothetical protein
MPEFQTEMICNPLRLNWKKLFQEFNCPQRLTGKKIVPQCHFVFQILCFYNYFSLFCSICQKGLYGHKR